MRLSVLKEMKPPRLKRGHEYTRGYTPHCNKLGESNLLVVRYGTVTSNKGLCLNESHSGYVTGSHSFGESLITIIQSPHYYKLKYHC